MASDHIQCEPRILVILVALELAAAKACLLSHGSLWHCDPLRHCSRFGLSIGRSRALIKLSENASDLHICATQEI